MLAFGSKEGRVGRPARDGSVDDARVDLATDVVAKSELGQFAGNVILDLERIWSRFGAFSSLEQTLTSTSALATRSLTRANPSALFKLTVTLRLPLFACKK